MLFAATAAVLVAVTLAQLHGLPGGLHSCRLIKNAQCKNFGTHDVCGSDGKTYANQCYFAQAHCVDIALNQAHEGPCSTGVRPTGDGSHHHHNHTSGGELSFSFYCRHFSHVPCGDDHEKLCGTDGKTYENLCTFEKEKCVDLSLDIKAMGACASTV